MTLKEQWTPEVLRGTPVWWEVTVRSCPKCGVVAQVEHRAGLFSPECGRVWEGRG